MVSWIRSERVGSNFDGCVVPCARRERVIKTKANPLQQAYAVSVWPTCKGHHNKVIKQSQSGASQ